ncbi:hypothetical protein ACFVOO_35390, partial [Streptomyces rochei]
LPRTANQAGQRLLKHGLAEYDRARSTFTWSEARAELSGLPGGGLNMAHEAVDRHASAANADKIALQCVARDSSVSR